VVNDFCIRPGYRANLTPSYFPDAPGDLVYQPHVYELAGFLAERAGCTHVIDVGCGAGGKLAALATRFEAIGIDHGANLDAARARGIHVMAQDLERGLPPMDAAALRRAVVVCADVVEHLVDPSALLDGLAQWSNECPYMLISTPDRDRVRGYGDSGPPANPAHVREWNADEFDALLTRHGFGPRLLGHTINTQRHCVKSTILALTGGEAGWRTAPALRVLAIVNVYNEADIIGETIHHLLRQGIDVLAVDNWSTDDSPAQLAALAAANPRVRVVRFPAAPSAQYEWKPLLENVETEAAASGYDWIIHNDADELRYAPWPGCTLQAALARVDALGYNAVDFTVADFRYLSDDAEVEGGMEERLRWFEFGRRPGHFVQIKAWRQIPGERHALASSGGHAIDRPGRRVFPLKFLVKHYPLRSNEQAWRKIHRDRLPRVVDEREALGWHTQYDRYADGTLPQWHRSALTPWSDRLFAAECLVERVSGIGIARDDNG
jgi:glycosyltransferase involved in cell wall biosynthesis